MGRKPKEEVKEVKPMTEADKVSMFKDHDEVMRRIIAESQREVANLNHNRELLILKNRQLDDELNRKQGLFDQNKRLEEQKMADIKNKFNNDEIARLYKLEQAEQNMVRREEEMQRRELLGIKIMEEKNKLTETRIEIEKLRSTGSAIMDEANRKMSEALSKFSQANIAEAKASKMLSESNAINDSLNQRENALKIKEKEVSANLKNFEEIKKSVDPKIEEIKLIEKNIEKSKKEIEQKEQEVNKKIYDDKTMIKDIEIEKNNLKYREKQLDQREEEITRKALLAGISG